MLHCLKLKWKLHLYTLPKKINNKCGNQPVILHILHEKQHKYFAYKYNISTSGILRYYFSKKLII